MNSKKVLLFAPYGLWRVHHQLDAVLGKSLQLRGCEVTAVCCDGLFEFCPVAGKPTNNTTCQLCAQSGSRLFEQFQLPVLQLRAFLHAKDLDQCRRWSESLTSDQVQNATFDGVNLSNWVYSGVFPYLLRGELDYSEADTIRIYKAFLYNGAILKTALERLLSFFPADQMICFNGVLHQYRIALELARRRDVRVLTHERGFNDDSFQLHENENINSAIGRRKVWRSWQNTPLTPDECQALKRYFFDREIGENTNFTAFYNFRSDAHDLRRALRIPANAKVVAFFTSSDWEVGQKERDIEASFRTEVEAIKRVVDVFRNREEYLIIRHHPNVVGEGHTGWYFLSELYKFNRTLPKNVRVLMPTEKLTSYSICWNADGLLTYGSTTGVESLARGLVGLSMFQNLYCVIDLGLNYLGSKELGAAISESLERTRAFDLEDLRRVYRGAHLIFLRLNYRFKSFGFRDPFTPEFRFKTLNALLPGHDETLDKVCSHIMWGTSLYPLPSNDGTRRSLEEETAFLEKELARIRLTRSDLKRRAAISENICEPLLSLVRFRQNGVQKPGNTYLAQSSARSRHKTIESIEMASPPHFSLDEFLNELSICVDTAKGDYLYFGPDTVHVDESLFSTAIDLMKSNAEYGAVASGAWLADKNGVIVDEFFTQRKFTDDYDGACGQFALLRNPIFVLSLFVWRRAALSEWMRSLLQEKPDSYDSLAKAIFTSVFNERVLCVAKSRLPNIVFYPPQAADNLAANGVALIKKDRWNEAHAYFEQANELDPTFPDLQLYRIMAKAWLGRIWEAVAVAQARLARQPDDEQVIALMERLDDLLKIQPLRYQDIAESVNSVEGWLVPGQEQYLFEKARSLPHDACILEIGSCFGRSTIALGFGCLNSRKKVYAIDTFMGNVAGGTRRRGLTFYDVWQTNIRRAGLDHIVSPKAGFSQRVLKEWHDIPQFDFVFIDASHHYDDIVHELELIYPLVKEGGWIAFHDVEPAWPGPWRIWNETAAKLLINHEICATLACGQKVNGRKFQRPSGNRVFRYSESWAKHLAGFSPKLSEALFQTLSGCPTDSDWQRAEAIIAAMPEHPSFKFSLREMLKLEAAEDAWLHYWHALTLENEAQWTSAIHALKEALMRSPENHLKRRVRYHLDRLHEHP